MKFKEIFEQVKKFFKMHKYEQSSEKDTKEVLLENIKSKIESKKKKLQNATSKKKKEKFKKEIEILKEFREKLKS